MKLYKVLVIMGNLKAYHYFRAYTPGDAFSACLVKFSDQYGSPNPTCLFNYAELVT